MRAFQTFQTPFNCHAFIMPDACCGLREMLSTTVLFSKIGKVFCIRLDLPSVKTNKQTNNQPNKLRNLFDFLNPLSTIVPNACCMLLFERNALYYRSLLKNWKSFLHSIGFAVSEPFLASRIEPACLFGCMCYVIPASIGQEVGKKWG